MDAVVDGKFPDDLYSMSIFRKVIGYKLSGGSRYDLYLRCRMKFVCDDVQTQALQFINLGIPSINTLNEIGILGTPGTKIQSLTDGSHWSALDHVIGE